MPEQVTAEDDLHRPTSLRVGAAEVYSTDAAHANVGAVPKAGGAAWWLGGEK